MSLYALRESKLVLSVATIVSFIAAAALLERCSSNPKTPTAMKPEPAVVRTTSPAPGPCRLSTSNIDIVTPELDCAAPPSGFDSAPYLGSTATPEMMKLAGPNFDSWAWSSFAAFNWPAQADATQPTGYVRGIPDVGQSFVRASGSEVLVWETFKEKREVFNNNVTLSQWQPLTYPPDQSLGPGGVPACTSDDALAAAKLPGGAHRRILQASKLAPALATGPNSLDETAEVASPAQEAQNALCDGYSGAALLNCRTNLFPRPAGGTGTTPYLPTQINSRPPVGPRVFDPNGNIVFYEVRVNYDYFNYVVSNNLNFLNPPTPPLTTPPPPLASPPYALPWRSSAAGPTTGRNKNRKLNYEANNTLAMYAPPPLTPPPIGSVQVKAAWKMLSFPDPAYHTTQAIYFKTTTPGNVCYKVATFGLIGLHIIQRVHMGNAATPGTPGDPVGGTFIFATWEHNSIQDGGGYQYVNYLARPPAGPILSYPARSNAITVKRQHPYPLSSTSKVTQGVYKQLAPGSVWSNYRLIGTQFYVNVGAKTSETQYNQPYYLANLVVETNTGLQNFQGLPPHIMPNKNYQPGFTPTTGSYDPALPNVSWHNVSPPPPPPPHAYTMGGCMGCHGVAQLLGTNFSFVLLDGQKGAGIDTPVDFTIPPAPPPTGAAGSRK